MNAPFSSRTHRRWLSDHERAVLLELFAHRPRLTCGQIQLSLQDQTGRTMSLQQICRTRHKAHRLGASDHPRRHLTERERLILNQLCRDAAPAYQAQPIIAKFRALTGRTIHRSTVSRFIERRLGIRPTATTSTRPHRYDRGRGQKYQTQHGGESRPMSRGASEGVPG